MQFTTWLAFFAASWAISISPGAGAVAAMSSGLNHGFRRGYFTTFGLILGILTQIVLVGAGLGALIAANIYAASFLNFRLSGIHSRVAKIAGMTPAMLIFRGRWLCWAANTLRPCCCFWA